MNKNSTFFSLLIIIALLFTSCAQLSELTVTKRHYRSGYLVDFGSAKKHIPILREKLSSQPMAKITPRKVKDDNSNSRTLEARKEITASTNVHFISQERNKSSYINSPNEVVENDRRSNDYSFIQSTSLNEYQRTKPASDAPFWLIIVFCILIPPLGVALQFGIIDKFWICLLLTLLFWLPGAIYALIVVTE